MADKWRVLTLSDHPFIPSGVGLQTRYILEGLLKTGRYSFRSFGGAMKHKNYTPQRTHEFEEDWIILPTQGYGDPNLIRQVLDTEQVDAVWFMTDPRFYGWLFNMSDEIRDRNIPLMYYHVWDNYPVPKYNQAFYKSCDYIGCISKLTHDIVCKLGMEEHSDYIPHAVDSTIFKQFSELDIHRLRKKHLGPNKDKFIVFYNSRNARRKMTADVIKIVKRLIDEVGQDEIFLLMHTDPKDQEGCDLIAVAEMLGVQNNQVGFSRDALELEQMAELYNVADVTMNISYNEGFGLSCLESLSCGTPVIINKTGGLQDQPVDDEGNVFGVVIEPSANTLTGSQQIPYIFDDRCSDKDLLDAVRTMYNMTRKERRKMGTAARKWTLKAFSMDRMVNGWDKAFTKYITEYKENGYPDRIRTQKI